MISVVMPVRNGGDAVVTALRSLLASPHISEILVADGASQDGTVERIEALADDRIRVVSRSDRGIYHGANKALAACTGTFIMFMNANDFLRPAYIDKAFRTVAPADADYYFGAIEMGGTTIKPRLANARKAKTVWQIMPFPHVSLIIRRSLHLELAPYDEQFSVSSDLDYLNRLLRRRARGVFVEAVAATCSEGGVSAGSTHVFEARRVAVKNGRSAVCATAVMLAILLWRRLRK